MRQLAERARPAWSAAARWSISSSRWNPRTASAHRPGSDDLAEEIARFGLAAAYQDVEEIGEQEQDLEADADAELDLDRLVESDTDGRHDITSIDISTSATVGEEAVD